MSAWFMKNHELDMKKLNPTKRITILKRVWYWSQTACIWAEPTSSPRQKDLCQCWRGRSSTGRLGLFIHVTAGFGDVGFAGYWTLEIFCIQPIRIYPNAEICQIYYHSIEGDYETI